MKVGSPVAAPKPKRQESHIDLYERVLSLAEGQSLPVELSTVEEAIGFWKNVCHAGRPGYKRGVRGTRRGRIVYLYPDHNGEQPQTEVRYGLTATGAYHHGQGYEVHWHMTRDGRQAFCGVKLGMLFAGGKPAGMLCSNCVRRRV